MFARPSAAPRRATCPKKPSGRTAPSASSRRAEALVLYRSPPPSTTREDEMHVRSTAALLVALVLAACQSSAGPPGGRVAVAPPPSVGSDIAIGADRQARLCASAFADRQNVPINDVTVSGNASPTGNTIVSLQS